MTFTKPSGGCLPPWRDWEATTTYTRLKIGGNASPKWRNTPGDRVANLPQMPLEGHFQRVNTPLRKLTPRERNVVIAGTIATVGVILTLILATASDSRPGPAAGCVSAVVAGRVGGEPVNGCGEDAKEICARSANYDNPRARTIGEVCDEAGIAVTPAEIAAAAQG
jgi:hypothetical protein